MQTVSRVAFPAPCSLIMIMQPRFSLPVRGVPRVLPERSHCYTNIFSTDYDYVHSFSRTGGGGEAAEGIFFFLFFLLLLTSSGREFFFFDMSPNFLAGGRPARPRALFLCSPSLSSTIPVSLESCPPHRLPLKISG
jgi:hypothetical protein